MSDLMEVRIFQRFFNQECVNTFHFNTTSITGSNTLSYNIVAALGFLASDPATSPTFWEIWKGCVTDDVVFTEVQARSVYSQTDFYTTPLVANNLGLLVGASLAPSTAYGFSSSRVRQDIRRGSRRIVGVQSSSILDGGVLNPDIKLVCDDLALAFGTTYTKDDSGNNVVFEPVIVSKQKYTTPKSNTAYKYYDTYAEQALHLAASGNWDVKPSTTTQNSRKYGRGA